MPGPGNLAYAASGIVTGELVEIPPVTPISYPVGGFEGGIIVAVIVVPSGNGFPFPSFIVIEIGGETVVPVVIVTLAGRPVTVIGPSPPTSNTLSKTFVALWPCVWAYT